MSKNQDFKGNAPENPNVVQLISFLYVGVAELNDGHLSDNEILKMVEKHKSYGVESENAFEFVKEAMYWWNDSVKKDFHFGYNLEQLEPWYQNNKYKPNL